MNAGIRRERAPAKKQLEQGHMSASSEPSRVTPNHTNLPINSHRQLSSPKLQIIKPQGVLTLIEKEDLADQEKVIEKGWQTFVEVGHALANIRDKKLYRGTHKTFESYCQERWQYAKSQAYRLIGGAQIVACLSPIGDIPLPTHEAQVRPLIGLEADKAKAAWKDAVARAGKGKVTAEIVKSILVDNQTVNGSSKRRVKRIAVSNRPVDNHLRFVKKIERALKTNPDKQLLIALLTEAMSLLSS
jgi:hypothetical protein